MKETEITWRETVEALGYEIVVVESDSEGQIKVKLSLDIGGAVGYGFGKTMEEAIKSASHRLPVDFYISRRKIAEKRTAEIEKKLIAECNSICRF